MKSENSMDRLNRLLIHPLYKKHYDRLQTAEKDRVFCGHNFQHFLDVARIGWIYVLENNLPVSKEVVYAYGFLHDLGRAEEYAGRQNHEKASAEIAEALLKDCGFTEEEDGLIIGAILHHRDKGLCGCSSFERLMYQADKASRDCMHCPAEGRCNWDQDKKNMKIEV